MGMERFGIGVTASRAVCPHCIGRAGGNLKGFVQFIHNHRYVQATSTLPVTSPGVRMLGAGS
jgi:hypothetical protein